MAEANQLKIYEICLVAPSASPSHFTLPLTFLDMSWLRQNPTSRLFFYKFPEPNTDDFASVILPKLKNSLSHTLGHYLPLAGNLSWPQDSDKPIVQYQIGDGVSLTVAETEADFDHLSGDNFRESDHLHSLLPDFPTTETQSHVMTLQITLFPSIGFSVGYMAHHAVMDGKSVSMFLHSWAYICRNGDGSALLHELTPFFDRSFVEQQEELERTWPYSFQKQEGPESKALKTFDVEAPPDMMLGTFKLTRDNINTLKKSVFGYWKEKSKENIPAHISTFTLSTAYVMVCLIKAKKVTAEKTYVGINVESRVRLDPPLPQTYFGNCVLGCGGGGDTKDFLLEDGLALAIEVISEGLASLNEGVIKLAHKIRGLLATARPKDFVVFSIAGSPRFELYKVDFGWGKPKKVEMISIDKTRAFYLSDDRDDKGGIEIGIGLKNHETEMFTSVFAAGLQAC